MKYKVFDLAYECDIAEFNTRDEAQEFILSRAEELAYNDYLVRTVLDDEYLSIEEYVHHFEEYAYKEHDYSTFYAHALCLWDGYIIIEE